MKMRSAALAVLVAVVLVCTGCPPAPTGPEAVSSVRPYCPFDDKVVIYNGDSLTTKWPAYVELPDGFEPYNTAKGGSMYSRNYLEPSFGTINSRILGELDACGNDIGVAVFSGGLLDLSYGVSGNETIGAIDALDEELHARGVESIFLTLTPVSNGTVWFPAHQADRRAVNAWMTTPGNMHSTVIDCGPALESAPGSDILATQYWNITDVFGTIDILHPNEAGYDVIAACAQPSILSALQD